MNKLKWEDLPSEIQNRMLQCQEEQRNPRNPEIFKNCIETVKMNGGFNWSDTKENYPFWQKIIEYGNIDHFYTRYPKESQPTKYEFKKGDYIVTLVDDGYCGKINYCSKQRVNDIYLKPCIDTKGLKNNGNDDFNINDKSNTKWRYATKEEAAEYERIGKPYDVTTLNKPQFIVGKWYKFFWTFSNEEVIIKVSSTSDDAVQSSFRVYLKDKDVNHTHIDGYYFREIINITEITDLSEIQPYLPEGHPDKIIKTSLVGRYAKCIEPCLNWTVGKYYKIVEGEKWEKLCITLEDDNDFCILAASFNNFKLMPEGFEPKSEKEFLLPEKGCVKVTNENKSNDRITYSESIQKEPTLYIKSKQNLLYTENFKTNELSLPTLIKPKKSLLINH